MPTTSRTNRSRFNSIASDGDKAASSIHTSVSRAQIEEKYQLRQLKPPKKPEVNDAPERFENVFLLRLQQTQKEIMKEDWAKQGRKNFFKKTIKGGLAEQLMQMHPNEPLPAGLELNPQEDSLIQIQPIKGRRDKEISDWIRESNFERQGVLNKFEDRAAVE